MKRFIATGFIATLCMSTAAFAQFENTFGTSVGSSRPRAAAPTSNGPLSMMDTNPLNHHQLTILREVAVPAQEAGVLDELNVQEGQLVEKGALLASIDRTDALLAVAVATHEYAAAKQTAENPLSIKAAVKAYEVAIADYESSLSANEKQDNIVMDTELRRQKLQADRAKMQAQLASHELLVANLDAKAKFAGLSRAKAALKRREIVSPINGVVVEKKKHLGEWVQPGETVLRIVQMDRLRVEGEIDGTKYAQHEVIGRPVKITVYLTGGGEELVEGKIVYASTIVQSNEFTIRCEIENRKVNGRWLLTPGLYAKVELMDAF